MSELSDADKALLSNLKRQRAAHKGTLTKNKNYVNNINTQILIDEKVYHILNARLGKLEPLYDQFKDIESQIFSLEPSETPPAGGGQEDDFEDLYFELVGLIKSMIQSFEDAKNSDNASEISGKTAGGGRNEGGRSSRKSSCRDGTKFQNKVNLPPLKVPTFDASYTNWFQFRDAFKVLVHDNPQISDIEKFIHLKNALNKDANQILEQIEISADNYHDAWQLLVDRYENKNLMIHNHLKSLFEYPNLIKENYADLRSFFDSFTKHLRALKTLGECTEHWDRLIIYLMSNKFDMSTRKEWEMFKAHKAQVQGNQKDLPSMVDMNIFLKARCELLEKIQVSKDRPEKVSFKSTSSRSYASTNQDLTSLSVSKLRCYYCNENHAIYACQGFNNLSSEQRVAEAKKIKLCLNCLNKNHFTWQCRQKKCATCHKPHHTLLHMNNYVAQKKSSSEVVFEGKTLAGDAERSVTHSCVNRPMAIHESVAKIIHGQDETDKMEDVIISGATTGVSQVLLSTAIVKIKIGDRIEQCRALVDGGSMSNFMTRDFCQYLNLNPKKIDHVVKGVGQAITNIEGQVNVTIMSRVGDYSRDLNLLVIKNITDRLPIKSFNKILIPINHNLCLADPNFNISSNIDILLSIPVFYSILLPEQKELGPNMPILQNTRLGWILGGNMNIQASENKATSVSCLSVGTEVLEEKISKFWEIEEINPKNLFSREEQYCEDYFQTTTTRDSDGRFIVSTPFKRSIENLGNSRDIALSRFYSLERKLDKIADLKSEYSKFMTEFENLGYMTAIQDSKPKISFNSYYLPHHAVLRNDSVTTKCRVVFNASQKTDSGLSLNDVQFTGPILQNDIFSILLRFRKYRYVICADISKMYCQIKVKESDCEYQKLFWRNTTSEELKCYRINRVVFGFTSAPFLAIRCLLQIANENTKRFPMASQIIKNDFFVDDLLTGADTKHEILKIQNEVSKILSDSGFPLRKWLCNDFEILNNFQVSNDLEVGILKISEGEANKTLGIYWNSNSDLIQYSISNFSTHKPITKRLVLSKICQIYDPLGLLQPVIIVAKLFMQELCKLQISWDDDLPQNLRADWLRFKNELTEINNFKIPRQAMISEYISIELHGFCDSSERAYGGCFYIRCQIAENEYISNLLCAKSRVAPIKKVNLPRLELCSAVTLAHLGKRVLNSLKINFNCKFFWTDSMVTLNWIRGDPSKWKTFVANRVSEIQSLTEISEWHHVRTHENPSDLLSRGTNPTLIQDSSLWWHGPDWLKQNSSEWNIKKVEIDSEIPEQKIIFSHILIENDSLNLIQNLLNLFSNLNKIIRVLAYIFRFFNNCKSQNKQYGVLKPMNLENSFYFLIKQVQKECFPHEYSDLLKENPLNKKSKILNLNPFMHNNLIRVGGRLKHSNYSFDKKHQIILPASHRLTELILQEEHKRLLHCGAQNLLASVRERFWPISGRNACKKIIRSCITCFKVNPSHSDYLMGNLPSVRIGEISVFTNVGVDYGGPFLIKDRLTRAAKKIKVYICLFICLCTKAVHIEMVTELTTKAFLASLNRFIGRRGKPTSIWSDNATNFVGANRELRELYEFLIKNHDEIANTLSIDMIKWQFIPARSPNFGGVWEAGIKRAKFHFKRIVGNAYLNLEEFNTVIIQIESILNSRPISPMSSDPNDLNALTPGHFLIGKSLTAIPYLDVSEVPENRLDKFQRLQSIVQNFWQRWRKEYLSELQVRTKWKQNLAVVLKVGSLVLIQDENAPPLLWKLGRVTKLYPGSDGITRVVDVKTFTGDYQRAITKLCTLPID